VSGLLAHSPADVVRQVLIDLGLGSDPDADPAQAWPVFAAGEPASPDEVVTVYNTSGVTSGRTAPDGERQEHHGLQVRVRSRGPDRGAVKANALAVGLDQQVHNKTVTLGTARYVVRAVTRTGGLLDLGEDDPNSKRYLITFNAIVALRQLS
jgi:hypothetical protein